MAYEGGPDPVGGAPAVSPVAAATPEIGRLVSDGAKDASASLRDSTATDADDSDCVLLGGTPETDPSRVTPRGEGDVGMSPAPTTSGVSGGGGSSEATSFDTPNTQHGRSGGNGAEADGAAAVLLPVSVASGGRAIAASMSPTATDSPQATQGAPGHVAKVVTRIETSAQVICSSQPNLNAAALAPGGGNGNGNGNANANHRASVSVMEGGFAAATSGALQRLRAARQAPETPVRRPSPRGRRITVDIDDEDDDNDDRVEGGNARETHETKTKTETDGETTSADVVVAVVAASPRKSEKDPCVDAIVEETPQDMAENHHHREGEGNDEEEEEEGRRAYRIDVDCDPEGLQDRVEEELSLAQRMSPLSPLSPPELGHSPAFIGVHPGGAGGDDAMSSPEYEMGAVDIDGRGVTFAATPEDIRVSVENTAAAAAASDDAVMSQSPDVIMTSPSTQVEGGGSAGGVGGGGGGWSNKKPPVPSSGVKDASFAVAVTARQYPNAHGALFASIGSPLGAAFPPSGKKHTPGKMNSHHVGGRGAGGGVGGGGVGGGEKMSGGKMLRKSVPSNVSASRVMSPLPISESVLERIHALGPEMQPMQRYILLVGIFLDFYAKTVLFRELSRFANTDAWSWFSLVFIFFLLSGCCTTAYWLLHYDMPTKQEIEKKYGEKAPKVFGFSKLDFKRMVRNAGAIFAMCQLGTAFAAWRALRTNDLRQRKAEMDLRGMQLVDTVFLTLPVATLQAYIGMACSSPSIVCPGRSGFDVLLFLAVAGAITSATLCFVSLDLHEKPTHMNWKQYWGAHKAHLSEMMAKGIFRFLELAARITTIALFASATGGWVFAIFFLHAAIAVLALWKGPKIMGGGVKDRKLWEKIVATKEVAMPEWWPEKFRKIRIPLLDDSKLLAATLVWPPSCFIANASDKHGKFWWRSKSCPRKSFMSLDRADAIFPLPAVITVQVFEAMLMLLIVGSVIHKYPHYQSYYVCTVLVNMAWLMSAVGWMSAAAVWNPFLPEGPPLGLPTGMSPGSGTVLKHIPRKDSNGNFNNGGGCGGGDGGVAGEEEGWSALDHHHNNNNNNGVGNGNGVAMIAHGGVAASVGGGLFSPSPGMMSQRATAGGRGRTPGRGGGDGDGGGGGGGGGWGGASPSADVVSAADGRASYSAGDRGGTLDTPPPGGADERERYGVGGTAFSATPYTGYKGAGGHTGGRGTAGMRRGDAGYGGGSAHGPHRTHEEKAAEVADDQDENASEDDVAQALNFQSVPEDFKYDYAAHAAAVAREQERAAAAASAAAPTVSRTAPPEADAASSQHHHYPHHQHHQQRDQTYGHRRTDSGGSSASVAGGVGGITGATPRLASPEYEGAGMMKQQPTAAGTTAVIGNGVPSGGLFGGRAGAGFNGQSQHHSTTFGAAAAAAAAAGGGGGGGGVHQSTTSTVSSVATPPFPGQSAGLKTLRTSIISTTSTEISREVNATLTAAVNELSPMKGGDSPAQRTSHGGRYSASSPLSEVNR